MAGSTKLLTSSGGGVILTPASNIASDVTVNIPSSNTTLVGTDTTQTLTNKTINGGAITGLTSLGSGSVGTPTQFNDSAGTQIGTLCRAWVNFNGSTPPVIRSSFNISSVTRVSAGVFTVTLSTALADANYAVITNCWSPASSALISGLNAIPSSASSFQVSVTNTAGTTNADPSEANVAIFR